MGTQENKAVVRRFTDEVLAGGNLSMADDLCTPDCKGLEFSDIASFKAGLTALRAHLSESEVNIDELIAEGDSVVARCSYRLTRPDGSTMTGRGLSYYRLADGKIMQSEVMTVPDIVQGLWQREVDGLVQCQLRGDSWLAPWGTRELKSFLNRASWEARAARAGPRHRHCQISTAHSSTQTGPGSPAAYLSGRDRLAAEPSLVSLHGALTDGQLV